MFTHYLSCYHVLYTAISQYQAKSKDLWEQVASNVILDFKLDWAPHREIECIACIQ